MSGGCMVNWDSSLEASTSVKVSSEPGVGLREYMSNAATNFSNISLPMGGKITTVDKTHIGIIIPRIKVLEFWLQPFAVAELRWVMFSHACHENTHQHASGTCGNSAHTQLWEWKATAIMRAG